MRILSVVLAGLLLNTLAFAAGEPTRGEKMTQFLDALDGHWQGQGTRDDLDLNVGRMERTKFDLDIEVDRSFGGESYDTRSTIELEGGQTEYGTNSYSVRGDLLFAQAYGASEPVRVVEASPLELVYEMKRAELYTGRVYDFRFDYRLTGANQMAGIERIELNGTVLREQQFTLRRW